MRYFIIILSILTVVACKRGNKTEIPVAEVKRGAFYIDLYEEGEIEATQSVQINSPNISWRYGMLKITNLVEDGSQVHAGDTVVIFDPSEVQKAIVDSEAELEIKEAELKQLKAEQQSTIEELGADLEITRLSQEISRIEFETANYEADIRKKEIQLNLEKANIALERAKEQLENRKKIQREELKQKMLEISQSESELQDARETLRKMFMVSPSNGIAIINHNWSSDNKFQEGDQCWSGYPLIELPDMSELKAVVQINEVDISKVTQGLRAEIKPDAFSDSVFDAEVIKVANLAVNKERGSKIKVFPVEVLIKSKNENLLPGLTVSCRIIVDEIDDVLYVPLEAVRSEAGKSFVYVKNVTGFEKKFIETGETNTDFTRIISGLKEGQKVALVNPFAEEAGDEEENSKQDADV
jgi:multidrug efflux pump subunit AcrA (membrane-fusion protein)